jgi:hypothetical protein
VITEVLLESGILAVPSESRRCDALQSFVVCTDCVDQVKKEFGV